MLKEVSIQNWRNISDITLEFKKGINIIIGPNGSGKTSILEVIFVALTGQTRFHKSPKELRMIGSEDKTKIRLLIQSAEKSFSIKRTFEKKSSTNFIIYNDSIVFKKNRNDVDYYILDYYKIKKNLFSSLIYLSEGEIYRFQDIKNRDQVIKYIEEILGVNKLSEFRNISMNLNNFFAREAKKLKTKMDQIKELQIESKIDPNEFRDDLNYFKKLQKKLKKQIEKKNKELIELKSERNSIRDLIKQYDHKFSEVKKYIKESFNKEILYIQEISDFENSIKENIKIFEIEIQEINYKIDLLKDRINKNELKLEEIKNKLENYEKLQRSNRPEIQCPICENILSKNHIEILKIKNSSIFKELQKKHEKNQEELSRKTSILKKKTFNKKSLENLITTTKYFKQDIEYINLEKKKEDLFILNQEIDQINFNKKRIEIEEEEIYSKIIELEKKLVSISASIKIQKIENYEHNFRATELGIFFGNLIKNSIEILIKNYKNNLLRSLINEMINIWKEFYPNDNRILSIDDKIFPIFKSGLYEINYAQLSAGEKTLLLVILKTLMIKYFSSIPFIILDEPLEHLDEENRSIIIDYLYKICKEKLIDQLILTTFEESIVRKFINLADTNIISLESFEKY